MNRRWVKPHLYSGKPKCRPTKKRFSRSSRRTNPPTSMKLWNGWSRHCHTIDGSPIYGSPVVVYNTVLSENLVYEVSVGGTMEAMDATSGAQVWTASVGSGAVDFPAVDSNTLYIGSDGGLLSALDAATGAVDCTFQLPILSPETAPGRIELSPVVGHDSRGPIVYFGDTGQSESNQPRSRMGRLRVRQHQRQLRPKMGARPRYLVQEQAFRDVVTAGPGHGFDRAHPRCVRNGPAR